MSPPVAPPHDPAWAHGDRGFLGSLSRALRALGGLGQRYVLCRGDKVRYLRRLGARIGRGAAVLTDVKGFGTEPWLVEIGARTTIAAGVVFLTHDGSSRIFRHLIPEGSAFGNRFGRVRVGDDCFVGVNTILLPGVNVGPMSIVGAGSVVTRDVPPRTVAAGVPARALCTLDDYIESYRRKMIPGLPSDRASLRRRLEEALREKAS